jgi:hypothetical protein
MNNKQIAVIDAALRYVNALYIQDRAETPEFSPAFSLAERLNGEARLHKAHADLVLAVDLLEGNE